MKPGIFIALAALALAIVGMPDSPAQAKGPKSLDLRVAGSAFIVITDAETGDLTVSTQGITKGSGGPDFSGQGIAAQPIMDASCPAERPLGGAFSVTLVFVFNDGSLLSVAATSEQGSYCSDLTRTDSVFKGMVTGGAKRFEGATGTWELTVTAEAARVTGNAHIDLN